MAAPAAELVERNPLREQLRAQLMLALHRSGRTAEALEAYRTARTTLLDELGIEPGDQLRQLHQSILNADASLASPVPEPSAPPLAAAVSPPRPSQPSRAAAPRLLPASIADFTGRTGETARLRDILAEGGAGPTVPIAVITGQPGVGKTALAVHCAHAAADLFPDGHLFADLHGEGGSPAHPRHVLARFLRTMGVEGSEIPEGTDERAEMYRTLLADRRILVVLDNAGTEHQVLPLLPGYPGCAVMITSRIRLAALPGTTQLELSTLGTEQSIELLASVAGTQRVSRDPAAAERLAELCGHLPLALRITGARLASRPNVPLARLVERLADTSRRLDELKYGAIGIRATLSLTYDNTSEDGRCLLRRLAILDFDSFPGWMAAVLLDDDLGDAQDLFDDLAEAYLVECTPPSDGSPHRYRLHGLTQLFARERAAEEPADQRTAALLRVLETLVDLAKEAHRLEYGGEYVQVRRTTRPLPPEMLDELAPTPIAWFERERANLLAAVRQAARAGFTELCCELALTAVTLYETRAYYDDWRESHQVALEAARRAEDPACTAAVLYSFGALCSAEQLFEQAAAHFAEAAGLFRELGDDHGAALAVRDIAFLDRIHGRLAKSCDRYEEALSLFRKVGDPAAIAFALHSLARVRLDAGQSDRSRPLLGEALELSRTCQSPRIEAQTLHRLGEVELADDRPRHAAERFNESLDLVRQTGDPLGEAYTLHGIGLASLRIGEFEAAEASLKRSLELAGDAGSQLAEVRVLMALADLAMGRNDPPTAAEHLQGALKVCHRIGAPWYEAQVYSRLCEALSSAGDPAAAAEASRRATALAESMDAPSLSLAVP